MTPAPLLVRWIAGDATRLRATLEAVFGIAVHGGGAIAIGGLRLEIAEGEPAPGNRAPDRLEVVTPAPRPGLARAADPRLGTAPDADDDPAAAGQRLPAPRLLALGWATVDHQRAAAAWPGMRWAVVPRDSIVGARALLGDPETAAADTAAADTAGIAIVLLEPDTEGRLAAALARHGEGPAALYVGLPAAAFATARRRLARLGIAAGAGSGPFGAGLAVAGPPAWGPTLIVVQAEGPDATVGATPDATVGAMPDATSSPARGGRGTIRP